MVTIHSPGAFPRASSAMRSWISRIERTRPSEGKTFRSASRSMCAWPSVMPGMTVLPARSTTRVVAAVCAAIAASGPTATIRSPAMAIACAIVDAASTVMILPFLRTRSAGPRAALAGAVGPLACSCACTAPAPPLVSMPAVPAAPATCRKRRRGMISSTANAPSGEIGDRARRLVVLLAEIRLDVFTISGGQAGIADHLPRGHVAVAAVHRVGEEALHADLQERVEEHGAGEAGERRLPLLHRLQRSFAVLFRQSVEVLAVGLARPLIGGGNAGAEEFPRRERELIAELGLALREWPIAIEPRAAAISARKLAVDESRDPALAAGGRKLVGGNDGVGGGGEEGMLGCDE